MLHKSKNPTIYPHTVHVHIIPTKRNNLKERKNEKSNKTERDTLGTLIIF